MIQQATQRFLHFLLLHAILIASGDLCYAQQVDYAYSLDGTLAGTPAAAPTLIELANSAGQTGSFASRTYPANICSGAPIGGYSFPRGAGLRIPIPAGFANKAYTLQMTFQIDDYTGNRSYASLVSTRYDQDWGLFTRFTDPTGNRASLFLYPPFPTTVWSNRFERPQFYTLTITRSGSGLVQVWVNCSLQYTYQEVPIIFLPWLVAEESYFPQPSHYYFTLFKDSPAQTQNEEAPGFVTHIKLSNYVWSNADLQQKCAFPCPALLAHEVEIEIEEEREVEGAPWLYEEVGQAGFRIGGLDTEAAVRVIGMDGKVHFAKRNFAAGDRVDGTAWSAGFYSVEIWKGERRFTKKFIKK